MRKASQYPSDIGMLKSVPLTRTFVIQKRFDRHTYPLSLQLIYKPHQTTGCSWSIYVSVAVTSHRDCSRWLTLTPAGHWSDHWSESQEVGIRWMLKVYV